MEEKNKTYFINLLKWNTMYLITVFLLNFFFWKQLFDFSGYLTYLLQSSVDLEKFSFLFSHLLFYFLFFAQTFWIYIFQKKQVAIYYSLVVYVCVSFTSLLKMIMGEHRPSFLYDNLRSDNKHFCENDYGMPSSHTFLVVTLSLLLLEQIQSNFHFLNKRLIVILNYGLMITIAFTRVYLGVHSFMQIFFGGLLAIQINIIVNLYKKQVIEHFIKPILQKSNKKQKILFWVLIGTFIYTLFTLGIYIYRKNWESINSNYFDGIINCKQVIGSRLSFASKDFGQALMIYYSLGFFLGIYYFEEDFESFCNFNFDDNKVLFFKRLIVIVIPQGVHLYKMPKIGDGNSGLLNPLRSIIIHFIFAFVSTRYGFILLKKLDISYQKQKPKNK